MSKWTKEEEAAKEMATQIEEEFLSKLKVLFIIYS